MLQIFPFVKKYLSKYKTNLSEILNPHTLMLCSATDRLREIVLLALDFFVNNQQHKLTYLSTANFVA